MKVSNSLRTQSNIYSTYSCGQEVMAQRYRMSDPSITTYCHGIIYRIISNSYYEIKFKDNTTQILKKSYFYVNNPKNQEEQHNYLSKLNELYGEGSSITINKNYYKNLSANYVSGTITSGSYDSGKFSVELDDGTTLNNVPLSEIITACDSYSTSKILEEEQEQEEETIYEETSPCENKTTFSPHLFVMQNKKILGYIQIVLTIVTFLIITYKIFIKFPILSQYESQFMIVKNIFMSLISLGTIFLAIILINKKTINLMNFLLLLSIFFLLFIFTYASKNKESIFLFDSLMKEGHLTDFDKFCLGSWSFIFPISMGPFYLLAYFILFIPMLIMSRFKSLQKYKIDCIGFFYGKMPDFLGNNKALYMVIIASFCLLYLYLITYFFNGYVDVSEKITQNHLTSDPLVQVKEVGKGIISLCKKYLYEVIFLVIVITGFIGNSIFEVVKMSVGMSVFVILILFMIYFFLVRIAIPYLHKTFNPNVSIKEFDTATNSFKVQILDLNNNVIGIKNVLPENLGKQLESTAVKIIDYDKITGKFNLKISISSTESKIVSIKNSNLTKYLSNNVSSNYFKVKNYLKKDLNGFDLTNNLFSKKSSTQIIIIIALIIGCLLAFGFFLFVIISVCIILYEKYGSSFSLKEEISEDVVSSISFY